jgi:hypothetical protein
MKTMFGRLLPGGFPGFGLAVGGLAKSSTEQGLSKPTSKPIQIEQTHREQTQSGLLKKRWI